MTIRPIHNSDDHKAALSRIEELWNAAPGSPEQAELEVRATLVDDYERKTVPIAAPNPIAAIKFRLEQLGLDRRALQPIIGARNRVAEVLNGKRPLTLPMIRRLHSQLSIPLESLIDGTRERKRRPSSARQRKERASISP
jgi:HTH-type transcriptional regulator/antitoxin HigA